MDRKAWKVFLEGELKSKPMSDDQDIYKLIHQACYGPAHIISDISASERYLTKEYSETRRDKKGTLYEPITPGGNIGRLNLGVAKKMRLDVSVIFDVLKTSANEFVEDENFMNIWFLAREIMNQQSTNEKLDELAMKPEPPAVHHSMLYKTAYKPAYRVVLLEVLNRKLNDLDIEPIKLLNE